MAGTISQWQQGAFSTPVNGTVADATVVLSNDNATRTKHNSHDADATIHVQSSTLAARPAASIAQRVWITTDGLRAYIDTGAAWNEVAYLSLAAGGTVSGPVVLSSTLSVAGLLTASAGATVASGQTLTLTGATVAGSPTWSAAQAFAAITATSVTASTSLALTATGNAVINVTSGAGNSAYTQYIRGATNKWASGTSILVGDGFEIYNNTLNADGLAIDVTTNNATFGGSVSVKSTTLLTTSLALTNGAAAATGTLTNAPAAGNPTKWIPINDNGTTRYIPAW